MEDKKTQVRRIYNATFRGDQAWNDWFFDHVYDDDEAMTLDVDGHAVSCMFLHGYTLSFLGSELPMAYVSGAATERNERNKGYMGRLLARGLRAARDRGDALVSLVPATRRLFFYYDRMGFATVVFLDINRYTSCHRFVCEAGYSYAVPEYAMLSALERRRGCTVLHSRRDWDNIMADLHHERGECVAVLDAGGRVAAMAMATGGNHITVREVLGDDGAAVECALARLQELLGPDKSMTVWRMPVGRRAMLRERGMMRIVNAQKVFEAMAAFDPAIKQVIRVRDGIVTDNDGIYVIRSGRCERNDNTGERVTLDIDVSVLTGIMFSEGGTGSIFGLPTRRVMLPLMLD